MTTGLDRGPTGIELHREVAAYCRKHGCSVEAFGVRSKVAPTTLSHMKRPGCKPVLLTVDRVRGFIAANPDGLPIGPKTRNRPMDSMAGAHGIARARAASLATPAPVVAPEQVAALDAAPARRVSPEYRARLRDASASERLATLCVETPGDLIATVRRQWPGQWTRIVAAARTAGTLPGAMLAQVIERGLEEA